MKRSLALILAVLILACLFAGCGGDTAGSDDDQGSVYYLNFKPEQDPKDIAQQAKKRKPGRPRKAK